VSAIRRKVVPTFDYKVAAGSAVFAATSGTVISIAAHLDEPELPGEFQFETRSSSGAQYQVLYDHVRTPVVAVGSVVAPGSLLGIAGVHRSNPAQGRVELQINHITQVRPTIVNVAVCPKNFGTPQFNQLNEAALAAHNSGNPGYGSPAVCVANQVSP
jgi:hypothetical protein